MPCTLTILYGKTRGHMGADQAPRPPCTPRHAHAHQLHLSCTASRHPSLARSLLTYASSLPFPPQEEERESPKPVTALILYGIPASTLPSSLPFPLQEEERERRLDYVPDESALNTNALEVRFLCVPRTIQVLQRIILGIYVVVVGTTAGWKPAAAAVPGPLQRQTSPRQALRRCSETRDQPQCRPDQSSTMQFMSIMAARGLSRSGMACPLWIGVWTCRYTGPGDTAQHCPCIAGPLVSCPLPGLCVIPP